MDRMAVWIQTFGGAKRVEGRQFFPFAPFCNHIHLDDIAHSLAMTCRFRGHCNTFYSVAEHCVRVSRLLQGTSATIEGLLHDAAEAYLGDIPTPIKDNLPFFFRDLEIKIHLQIIIRFDIHSSPWSRKLVARADRRLLATEKRDLMKKEPAPWGKLPPPLPEVIKPWTWRKAEKEFLKRAKEIGVEVGCDAKKS